MKSWLIKFIISNALNDRRPLPPAIERTINRSEDLRRFAENSSTVDDTLKSELPRPEASPRLHESIMRAIRTSRPARVADQPAIGSRWIPVSSLGALIVLGGFLLLKSPSHTRIKIQPENPRTLAAAGSAMELGGRLVRDLPAAAVSPLSDELQTLDRNVAAAKQFLLASLP